MDGQERPRFFALTLALSKVEKSAEVIISNKENIKGGKREEWCEELCRLDRLRRTPYSSTLASFGSQISVRSDGRCCQEQGGQQRKIERIESGEHYTALVLPKKPSVDKMLRGQRVKLQNSGISCQMAPLIPIHACIMHKRIEPH